MTHQTHTSTFINPMLGLILGLGSAGGCYTAADTIGQAQLAEVWRPHVGMALVAQIAPRHVVGDHQQEIGPLVGQRQIAGRRDDQQANG